MPVRLLGALSVSTSAVSGTAGTPTDPDITTANVLYTTATMGMYIDVDENDSFNAGDLGMKSDGTIYNYCATALASHTTTATATLNGDAVGSISGGTFTGFENITDVVRSPVAAAAGRSQRRAPAAAATGTADHVRAVFKAGEGATGDGADGITVQSGSARSGVTCQGGGTIVVNGARPTSHRGPRR